MLVYVFEFDIVPGKNKEFWEFMKEEGTKFWLQFPEVKKYEVYSKIGGDGSFEGHVLSLIHISLPWAQPERPSAWFRAC